MDERWTAVRGYEGLYDVSSLGRVRSYRVRGRGHRVCSEPQHTLRPAPRRGGYLFVVLSDAEGARRHHSVHVLVLEAFVGPRPLGCEGSHIKNDRTNCRLDNLVWETKLENAARTAADGTRTWGEKNFNAKLDPAKVREIRRLRADGTTLVQLGARFGVHHSQISAIVRGKAWAHVKGSADHSPKMEF